MGFYAYSGDSYASVLCSALSADLRSVALRTHLQAQRLGMTVLNPDQFMKEVISMKDCNCGYCMGGEILAGFGIKICDLKVSQLILFKEQSHPGRVIVAYKDHVSELVNISAEERALFFEDVATAANAIHKAFSPDKVNYGAYGDGGCHLHFHLVPKYQGEFEWGTPFAMNPGKTYLTEEEYAAMIEKIKAAL